jgi:hypothetical protein
MNTESEKNGLWMLICAAMLVMGLLLGCFVCSSFAQTPPISTVQALPDTNCCTLAVTLVVDVESSIPWDTQQVGIYWTAPGLEGWNYAGSTRDTLTWQVPADNLEYYFSSTVDDDDGNSEGYEFVIESSTYVCSSCLPPSGECPPTTPLQALQILAEAGFDMQADSPAVRWWWTHPTTGNPVVRYEVEWRVDGISSFINGIAVGDTSFAFWLAPMTPGQTQDLRVHGWDALDGAGTWSVWGDPWNDQGPPGAPETVGRDLQMVD